MPDFGSDDDGDEERMIKSLKGTVSALYTLSNSAVIGETTSLVRQNTDGYSMSLTLPL